MIQQTALLFSLVTASIEMAACFICSWLMWRLQKETKDRSSRLLVMGAFICGLTALWVVTKNMLMFNHGTAAVNLLNPWMCIVYLSLHIVMTLYPISIVKQDWLTPRHFTYLFLPVLVLTVVFLFFTGAWTPLETPADIRMQLGKPDVLVRVISQCIMLPYSFILFVIPYNPHSSSASARWINIYSLLLLALSLMHLVNCFFGNRPLMIVFPLLATFFFLVSTQFEMEDRLNPGKETTTEKHGKASAERETSETQTAPAADDEALWQRICRAMDEEQAWKDPNISILTMSRRCTTNTTYLLRTIRGHTGGGGFKELLNSKRVAAIVSQIKENPDIDVQAAFYNAGYRSRTTAWRNFKEITGMSPAEYRQSLTKQ